MQLGDNPMNSKYYLFPGENDQTSDKNAETAEPISPTRTLRRKRCAIGSMEDLWDETIFEEPIKFKNPNVLNIPAIMDNFENAKAAKKAMRKARKEAKKFVKSSKHKHKRKKHKKERNYSGEDEKHTIQRYFEILKIL